MTSGPVSRLVAHCHLLRVYRKTGKPVGVARVAETAVPFPRSHPSSLACAHPLSPALRRRPLSLHPRERARHRPCRARPRVQRPRRASWSDARPRRCRWWRGTAASAPRQLPRRRPIPIICSVSSNRPEQWLPDLSRALGSMKVDSHLYFFSLDSVRLYSSDLAWGLR